MFFLQPWQPVAAGSLGVCLVSFPCFVADVDFDGWLIVVSWESSVASLERATA